MDGIASVQTRIQDIISQFQGPPAASPAESTDTVARPRPGPVAAPTSRRRSRRRSRPTQPARPFPRQPAALNRAGVDPVQWAKDFLTRLGAPITPSNVQAITAWEKAEGTKAAFNPLATTQGGYAGETTFNSVGVKNYASYQDGLDANVQVINNGLYTQHPRRAAAGHQRPGRRAGRRELTLGNRHRRRTRPSRPGN